MSIKSIRLETNLTQAEFAEKFGIPLQTIKQWEADISSKSYRKPPKYVETLIENAIASEKKAEHSSELQKIRYLLNAAKHSRYHAKQWYRYLRKQFDGDRFLLKEDQITFLLESNDLTMFQKVILKQAAIPGTPINEYIISLNKPANTKMFDEILRKYQ